ncbi:MAG: extracellular solute-binding protein [Lachnospiraceae bacterium]|nr:extracellular solute-binding protein [Lachnospiraceae bacterium]
MTISLAACGGGEKSGGGRGTLTLALREGTYADVIEQCLPAFEEEHGVKCVVEKLSEEDLHGGVVEDAGNSDGKYDLCMVDGSWMAEYTSQNILTSLSDLGYELDDDIIPATTKIAYYGDEVYLAPYYGNVTVLLYNRSLVEAAGYTGDDISNLEDVKKISEAAKAAGKSGFIYRGDTPNNLVVDFLPILLSFGGWVVDEGNNPTVDTIAFHDAMEFYLELIKTGEPMEKQAMIDAISGDTGALGIAWPGWYTPEEGSPADYCALSGRVDENSTSYNANVYGVWTIGIPENSTNKGKALELLEYLMDPGVQKSTVDAGGVPCRYSSLADPDILEKYPQYEAVREALESGTYRPIMMEWPDFYTILGTAMDRIIKGKNTLDDGLAEAQSQLEELMTTSTAN